MERTAGDPNSAEPDDKSAADAAAVALAMERTAGDPKSVEPDDKSADYQKSAEPDDKSAADYQKSAGPEDKGAADFRSESDKKRGVDGSGYDDQQVNAESLSSGSYDKRVPRPHLPHDAGVGRSGSDDNKGGSGSRSAESEDKRATPRSRLNANAAEFIPRARAPSLTPPPPKVDATGGFRPTSSTPSPSASTPSPSPTPTTPPSIGLASPSPSPARSSGDSSSRPQPRPQQHAMQGYSAVAKHGTAMKLEMEKNKQQMLQYLNSADGAHYEIQAANLARKLTVDFEDLLQKNRKLAIQICNNRGSNDTWLNEACKTFFESMQLASDGVRFEFANIPSRLQEALDFMQSKDCTEGRNICSNISYIETATEHGREVTDLVLNRLLDWVADKGVSWDGKLGLGDILFGETMEGQVNVYISKSPVYKLDVPTQPRLADVRSIWGIIEGGCKLDESNLPLYFLELKSDLENASHLSDWFIQYLRFHPALYASTPRRYFITSMQMVTRRLGLIHVTEYNSLFTIHPSIVDWRSTIGDSGPLKDLLNFEFRIGTKKASKKKTKKNRKQKEQYKNTYGSLLDYVKNGLSHLAQYISVIDDDEIELFLALKFPKLLPDILKGILMRGGMGDRFAACWKTYRKTK